ncbi:MAG: type III pantothenate kinase [Bacteroidales bacterium]|nr:type III pantothenate kinase [Bacteroidales bacterium]
MKHRLVLDFGNTLRKIAVFRGSEQLELRATKDDVIGIIEGFKQLYPNLDSAILSSVVKIDIHLMAYLKINFHFIYFDHLTRIPIKNNYQTLETLGRDRLAAAVGAVLIFPQKNVLVIDAGSSITYEIVTKDGEYIGGAISLGIKMRAKALEYFTDQLPLVDTPVEAQLIGNDTLTSLQSGIINGANAEIHGMIQSFSESFKNLKIILTGGDAKYFEKSLKNNIFASENLVLMGLNYILDYNEL